MLLAVLLTACGGQLTVDNSAVDSLDLNRYLGDWYEIARFDHRFVRLLKLRQQRSIPN